MIRAIKLILCMCKINCAQKRRQQSVGFYNGVRSLLGAIFTGYSKFISQWENQSIAIFSANGLIIKPRRAESNNVLTKALLAEN